MNSVVQIYSSHAHMHSHAISYSQFFRHIGCLTKRCNWWTNWYVKKKLPDKNNKQTANHIPLSLLFWIRFSLLTPSHHRLRVAECGAPAFNLCILTNTHVVFLFVMLMISMLLTILQRNALLAVCHVSKRYSVCSLLCFQEILCLLFVIFQRNILFALCDGSNNDGFVGCLPVVSLLRVSPQSSIQFQMASFSHLRQQGTLSFVLP